MCKLQIILTAQGTLVPFFWFCTFGMVLSFWSDVVLAPFHFHLWLLKVLPQKVRKKYLMNLLNNSMYIDIYMMYNISFSVWLSTISTCTCSFSLVYHSYSSCIHQWLHNSFNLKLFFWKGWVGFYLTCLLFYR